MSTSNGKAVTQMHHARRGAVTDQMKHVAQVEGLDAETVRSEVARGRMIIPANVNHRNLKPCGIGIAARCKINANLGNSAIVSDIDEELKKVEIAVRYGPGAPSRLPRGFGPIRR